MQPDSRALETMHRLLAEELLDEQVQAMVPPSDPRVRGVPTIAPVLSIAELGACKAALRTCRAPQPQGAPGQKFGGRRH